MATKNKGVGLVDPECAPTKYFSLKDQHGGDILVETKHCMLQYYCTYSIV